MVSSRPLNKPDMSSLSSDTPDIHTLSSYRRLSLLNGLLIGLAIALGFWTLKLYNIFQLPVAAETYLSGALVSSFLIIALCMMISWVSGRLNKTWLTIILWLIAGGVFPIILGYIPAYSQNLSVWLAGPLFAGLYVYAIPSGNEWWSFVIAGLALIFILFVLAVLQAIRLERAFNLLKPGGKLSAGASFSLLIPALFAALGAYMMPDHLSSAPREALAITHQAIQTVQDFEGDAGELFELTRETGYNYIALNGVRDLLEGQYSLMVGEVDPDGFRVVITAHFDTGGWVNCNVNTFAGRATYLSFCADASRPFAEGFASLITGEPVPENCPNCLPEANKEWVSWLQARATQFQGNPQFQRLIQQGSYVWMRATSPDNMYAVDCLFSGIDDTQLQNCIEVSE